jgi:hypothetical protein
MNHVPDLEDAIQYMIRYLREGGRAAAGGLPSYGYGFYLPNLMRAYASDTGTPQGQVEARLPPLSPVFYAAAWELCRKGIIRPGLREYGRQATGDGGSGNGYTVTPFGETWIREAAQADYVPVEPGRFARMLADRGGQFGQGFVERSQEAVSAYNAHAYLACCAMCGAAAESLMLALAIEKSEDEQRVLRDYASAGGRGRIERALLQGQTPQVEADFRRYTDLLKYWRDSASHGRAVHMTEAEAFSALILLLRFVIFAAEHREDLTA